MSSLTEVADGDRKSTTEPELSRTTSKRNAGDLLSLVYELPKEFTDGTWENKPQEQHTDTVSRLSPNNDTVGGHNITNHVRSKMDTGYRSATTNISLKEVMSSNKALRLTRTSRNEAPDPNELQDEDCDNQKLISVTECSEQTQLVPSLKYCNNNNIERRSFSGSPKVSPTPYQGSSNRNFASSPVDFSDISDEELDSFNKTLTNNPELLEKWLKEKANPDILKRVHTITEPPVINSGSKRTSVTSELFQLWLTSSPVKVS